jgi:polysaccharide deacetylase family protein (PEP-CTERM system associated)
VINPGVIGTIEDIPSLVQQLNVDRVVVSLSEARGRLPMDRLLDIRLQNGVNFDYLASVYEEYTGKIAIENLRPSWFIFADGFRKTRVSTAVKRAFDVVLSLAALVVGLPVMAAVALLVKATSRGPVLYHQGAWVSTAARSRCTSSARCGWTPRRQSGPVWSAKHDERVTPIGRFCGARLDELPQLWNVLGGDMSFVGPRPERPMFVDELTAKIPFYGQRHVLKPGLTGWAQVRYTYGASVEDAIEKLQYDLYYTKPVVRARPRNRARDHQDRPPAAWGAMTVGVPAAGEIVNAMSVDVEDYFQVSAFDRVVSRAGWDGFESRVVSNTQRVLDLFDRAGVCSTFFVLGWVAERFPALVREIAAAGHEVASHGYHHQLIYTLTPAQFREDVRASKSVLEHAAGAHVLGYRAPSYSILNQACGHSISWSRGYAYDASIFPIHHHRYGIPNAERHAHVLRRRSGALVELPASTMRVGGVNLPIAGGGYFRLLPYAWTRWGIGRVNRRERKPVVFYFHPWEIDRASRDSPSARPAGSGTTGASTGRPLGCGGCSASSDSSRSRPS